MIRGVQVADAQQLSSVAEAVLRQFGEAGVQPQPTNRPFEQDLRHFVRIAIGDRGAALLIGAGDGVAAALAECMFERSAAELGATDWIDALGELGNILAGKIEGELGSDRSLGIPSYFEASDGTAWRRTTGIEAESWRYFAAHPIYFAVVSGGSPDVPT